MRRLAFALAGALALFAASCRGGGSEAPPAESGLELRNGRWFDGSAFRQRTMYVAGSSLAEAAPRRITKSIDLGGGWVVPPFAEGHNHWLEPGAIAAYDALYLRDGVFYLKDMANASAVRKRLDAALNRPTTVDFVSANEGWTGPAGIPTRSRCSS
jgi:hypothetical protein